MVSRLVSYHPDWTFVGTDPARLHVATNILELVGTNRYAVGLNIDGDDCRSIWGWIFGNTDVFFALAVIREYLDFAGILKRIDKVVVRMH